MKRFEDCKTSNIPVPTKLPTNKIQKNSRSRTREANLQSSRIWKYSNTKNTYVHVRMSAIREWCLNNALGTYLSLLVFGQVFSLSAAAHADQPRQCPINQTPSALGHNTALVQDSQGKDVEEDGGRGHGDPESEVMRHYRGRESRMGQKG